MKKIVDFMKAVFFNKSRKSDETNKRIINYWCPTGMNPIMLNNK